MRIIACLFISFVLFVFPCTPHAKNIGYVFGGKYLDSDSKLHQWGEKEMAGADLAWQYYCGINNCSNINLYKYPYSTQPLSILSALNVSVKDRISIYAGASWSNDAMLAFNFLNTHKKNLVSSMASSTKIKNNKRVITVIPSTRYMVSNLIDKLSSIKLKCDKFSIVYEADDEYSVNLLNVLKSYGFEKLFANNKTFSEHPILKSNTRIEKTLLEHLNTLTGKDCIFLALHEHYAGLIANVIANNNNPPVLLASSSLGEVGSSFWSLIEQDKICNINGYSVFPWSNSSTVGLQATFRKLYRKKHGKIPDDLNYYSFKALLTAMILINDAGVLPSSNIQEVVSKKQNRDLLKKYGIQFDKMGYGVEKIHFIEFRCGKFVFIK